MLLVEQARNLEERARVLGDHVRRVAVRPVRIEQRDVAVRKGESLEREFVRRAHDVHVDARGGTQRAEVDGLQSIEPARGAFRDGPLARGRAIGELRLERGAFAGVDAERGGALGIVDQHFLGKSGEQPFGGGIACPMNRPARRRVAASAAPEAMTKSLRVVVMAYCP